MKRPRLRSAFSTVLILSGMGALVAFAGSFGLRWGLLAGAVCLLFLGVAVGGE